MVSVTSTTIEILYFLRDLFGGNIITRAKQKEHHKQTFVWQVSRDRALLCCERVLPFLLEPIKLRRAWMLVEEYKIVTPRNGKYNEKSLRLKADFEKRFLKSPQGLTLE